MKKNLKRILPIVLLLSLCVGLLSGCDIVSANEPPIVTQAPSPTIEEKPTDDGIFTITDDEGMGEIYAKILNGEIVFECIHRDNPRWERSPLNATEYFMGVLKRLNTLAVEPITSEEWREAELGEAMGEIGGIYARSLSDNIIMDVRLGSNYIGIFISAISGAASIPCGYFRTEENVNSIKNELKNFFILEVESKPNSSIGNSGNVGSDWSNFMEADVSKRTPWCNISGFDNKNRQRLYIDDDDIEKKRALVDILQGLDGLIVKEVTDVCVCENCVDETPWAIDNYLLNIVVGPGYLRGFSILVYYDGISVSSVSTGETAYFELQYNAGKTIHNAITKLMDEYKVTKLTD